MNNKGFTFRKRIAGFKYAFHGIGLLCNEHNVWLHGIIGLCVVVAGFLLDISAMEWVVVVIVCGGVFAAEALNTAIEKLADVVSPEYNEAIKKIKDLSAGGVLLMAITAAITGLILFLPKLIALFEINKS
ncbi:MAG: diacylglycerol kinase family protein [Tannerella sp.]|jgi:diacylglycerol kinase (ATP)|nr:diacylglycerol kinase family protein [Tannerella sp.]